MHQGVRAYDAGVNVAGLSVDEEQLRRVCQRYGVARLEVFGSVGRGEGDEDSDVDLLYELAPGARLGWHVEDLADELSAALGRRVDLISRNGLHERLRERVLSEARLLYAA
jgi:predicted nucleotidyltransferase